MKRTCINGEIIAQLGNGAEYRYCTRSKTEEVYKDGRRIHYYKYPLDHVMPVSDFYDNCEMWCNRVDNSENVRNYNIILNIY